MLRVGLVAFASWGSVGAVRAQDTGDLAGKLSNPVADLISVPFQSNWDQSIGRGRDGERFTLNVQPVYPMALNDAWNLISRTIVPLVYQDDVIRGHDDVGMGDVLQSLFLSPVEPTSAGLIWGVGPVFLAPTATRDEIGGRKWGAGPTAVLLKQSHGWTCGALLNHVWSFAGSDGRSNVNQSFLQPFVSFSTHDAWTYSLNAESTYDWKADDWSIPVNATVAKLTNVGGLHLQLQGGVRYYLEHSEAGPRGLGLRITLTLLFPR